MVCVLGGGVAESFRVFVLRRVLSPFSPLLLLALHVNFLVVAPFLITLSKSGFFAPLLIVVGVLFGASLVRVCGCVRVADIHDVARGPE